ncbi:redoxin domain-containing protein [Alistipes sp.]|uniref:redoxin domain-containing protein n=1 Tax=Alistipes sp. TaxID=1872444 RepID=UPI003AEF4555
MKRFTLLAAVAAMMCACCGSAEKYTLTGTVDTLYNGGTAYLTIGEAKDSTTIENGAFRFEGRIDTPVMARVMVQQGKQRNGGQVLLEAGAPRIELGEESYSVSGTPLNETLEAYNKQMDALYKDYMEGYRTVRSNEELTEEQARAQMEIYRDAYGKGSDEVNRAFFDANKDNTLGSLAVMRLAENKEQFDSLYNAGGELLRRSPYMVREKARYEMLGKTAAGQMFTDFTIENGAADGSAVSLSDYVGKGKYVLVDFWASWCGPCRGELPNLKEVYKKYGGDRFEIVGVAVWDKRADTEKAVAEEELPWPVIYDAQKIPTDIYGIDGIPQIILFGPDGVIVARDLRGEKVGEKIAECLNR